MTFTVETYDPIAHMNRVRESKPASGGKNYKRPTITNAARRERDADLDSVDMALDVVVSIWSEFRSFAADSRMRAMVGDVCGDAEIPF